MPVTKKYDPNDIAITFNGILITGHADGTFIEVEAEDGFVKHVGSSGDVCIVNKNKDKDKWNGACETCGKGTYTGMNNVEHEGGKCDRS